MLALFGWPELLLNTVSTFSPGSDLSGSKTKSHWVESKKKGWETGGLLLFFSFLFLVRWITGYKCRHDKQRHSSRADLRLLLSSRILFYLNLWHEADWNPCLQDEVKLAIVNGCFKCTGDAGMWWEMWKVLYYCDL